MSVDSNRLKTDDSYLREIYDKILNQKQNNTFYKSMSHEFIIQASIVDLVLYQEGFSEPGMTMHSNTVLELAILIGNRLGIIFNTNFYDRGYIQSQKIV